MLQTRTGLSPITRSPCRREGQRSCLSACDLREHPGPGPRHHRCCKHRDDKARCLCLTPRWPGLFRGGPFCRWENQGRRTIADCIRMTRNWDGWNPSLDLAVVSNIGGVKHLPQGQVRGQCWIFRRTVVQVFLTPNSVSSPTADCKSSYTCSWVMSASLSNMEECPVTSCIVKGNSGWHRLAHVRTVAGTGHAVTAQAVDLFPPFSCTKIRVLPF